MKANLFNYLLMFCLVVASSGCESLDVKNLNEPDTEGVLATASYNLEIASGTFRKWYNAVQSYSGPGILVAVASDQSTCSWGSGMLDVSQEPRVSWNNSVDYAYGYKTYNFFTELQSIISQSNDVIGQINNGMEVKDADHKNMNPQVLAMSYLSKGIATAYLGLFFDKGFVCLENSLPGNLVFSEWQVMVDSSLIWLDKATTLCNTNEFVLPEGWINGSALDQSELSQAINSFSARIMTSCARNKIQNQALDWSKILSYAENGLDFDFSIYTDDRTWINNVLGYLIYPGWARIDHRIINLMDPDYPARWPYDNVSWPTPNGNDPGPASTNDYRIADFEYLETQAFRPERGYYHFSHYRHDRYDDWLGMGWKGPLPAFMKAENDLILAEAKLRMGDREGAIAILNDQEGSRIKRGGLSPLDEGATFQEVLDAIFYERDIELINSSAGISFFDMRRRDMLQPGTFLHFPVPGKELEALRETNYTFGGTQGIPGEDYSIGGWF